MKYTSLLISLILLENGCKQPTDPKVANSWSSLTIISEQSTVIKINNYDDTTTVKYYDGGGFFTGYHKVKVDSLKSYFTMAEKDSLYLLTKDIICNPVKSKSFLNYLLIIVVSLRHPDISDNRLNIAVSAIGIHCLRKQFNYIKYLKEK